MMMMPPSSGGGGAIIVVVIILILVAAAAGYYVYTQQTHTAAAASDVSAAPPPPVPPPDTTAYGSSAPGAAPSTTSATAGASAGAPSTTSATAGASAGAPAAPAAAAAPIIAIGVGKDTFVYVKTGTPASPWIKIPGSDGVKQVSQSPIDGSLIGASTNAKILNKVSLDPATHWNPVTIDHSDWSFNEIHQRNDGLMIGLGLDGKTYCFAGPATGPLTQNNDAGWGRWCCLDGINFSQDGGYLWGANRAGSIWKKASKAAVVPGAGLDSMRDDNWAGGGPVTNTTPPMLSIVDMSDGTLLAIGNDNKTYTLSSSAGTPQATADTVDMLKVSKWDKTKGLQWLPPATTTSTYTSEPVSNYEIEPITSTAWDYMGVVE
jgi:hypothetical protein